MDTIDPVAAILAAGSASPEVKGDVPALIAHYRRLREQLGTVGPDGNRQERERAPSPGGSSAPAPVDRDPIELPRGGGQIYALA